MTRHPAMSPEHWASLTLTEQIRMIAGEMDRAGKCERPEDRLDAYTEAIRLADLTILTRNNPGLKRELTLWRDYVASMIHDPQPSSHRDALHALLLTTPETFRQIPYVLGTNP